MTTPTDPKHCPYCGGHSIVFANTWRAQSEDPQDAGNVAELDEYQCRDCDNRSFGLDMTKNEDSPTKKIVKKSYLLALPGFSGQKGFNCPTILVSAKDENDALSIVRHLRPGAHIGDIKQVNY